jgi:hypothetical protein
MKLVRNMKSAGMLIMSCTTVSGESEKCSLIVPRAGATAAPAITVRRDSDRIAVIIPFLFFVLSIVTSFLRTAIKKRRSDRDMQSDLRLSATHCEMYYSKNTLPM